eukprot:6333252-Amphidinium_carterae.2
MGQTVYDRCQCDCLVLVVYLPWGVEIWEARKGFQEKFFSHGVQARSVVAICRSRGNCGLHSAWLQTIVPKLEDVANRIGTLFFCTQFDRGVLAAAGACTAHKEKDCSLGYDFYRVH